MASLQTSQTIGCNFLRYVSWDVIPTPRVIDSTDTNIIATHIWASRAVRGGAVARGAAARAAARGAAAPWGWRWPSRPTPPPTRAGARRHAGPTRTGTARSRLAAPFRPPAPPCTRGDEWWRFLGLVGAKQRLRLHLCSWKEIVSVRF